MACKSAIPIPAVYDISRDIDRTGGLVTRFEGVRRDCHERQRQFEFHRRGIVIARSSCNDFCYKSALHIPLKLTINFGRLGFPGGIRDH